jgi:hypothetical protein
VQVVEDGRPTTYEVTVKRSKEGYADLKEINDCFSGRSKEIPTVSMQVSGIFPVKP